MRIRFRVPVALVALLALTAYFAEGVWASTCAPVMETAHAAELDGGHEVAPTCEPGGEHAPDGGPDAAEHAPEHAPSDGPGCPLGPLGTGGSCVAVPLAAPASDSETLPIVSILQPVSPDAALDVLLALNVFHPPRA